MTLPFDCHEVGPNGEVLCFPSRPCRNCKLMKFLSHELHGNLKELEKLMAHLQLSPKTDVAATDKDAGINPEKTAVLEENVDGWELSIRAMNGLKNNEIVTVRQLVTKSPLELLRTPGFGRKSLNDIQYILAQKGLQLGMTDETVDYFERSKSK